MPYRREVSDFEMQKLLQSNTEEDTSIVRPTQPDQRIYDAVAEGMSVGSFFLHLLRSHCCFVLVVGSHCRLRDLLSRPHDHAINYQDELGRNVIMIAVIMVRMCWSVSHLAPHVSHLGRL